MKSQIIYIYSLTCFSFGLSLVPSPRALLLPQATMPSQIRLSCAVVGAISLYLKASSIL